MKSVLLDNSILPPSFIVVTLDDSFALRIIVSPSEKIPASIEVKSLAAIEPSV
jgi:hypothetical protein